MTAEYDGGPVLVRLTSDDDVLARMAEVFEHPAYRTRSLTGRDVAAVLRAVAEAGGAAEPGDDEGAG